MQKHNHKKELLPLFVKFIQESKNGKRIQKNGKRISKNAIANYHNTLKYLIALNTKNISPIVINTKFKPTKQDAIKDKKYWANFFVAFKKEMYASGCSDNYVGLCIKNLKTFFKYLETDKNFPPASFYKQFYPPNSETQIFVLDQEKLKFIINNDLFNKTLPSYLSSSKDVFVFGCTVGLRFSDLMRLKHNNLEIVNNKVYVAAVSQKTNTPTRIKLPDYAIEIINNYKSKKSKYLLPQISLINFNANLKLIGEIAGWTQSINKEKTINGNKRELKTKDGKSYRFCDALSSHVMRKTAITTLLTLGMPEPLVRKISGHAADSKEFYKYVKYSESFLDSETDKAFARLVE